jgi:hypothetical protein
VKSFGTCFGLLLCGLLTQGCAHPLPWTSSKAPASVSRPATTFSSAHYRSLGILEREAMLRDVEKMRCRATPAELMAAYLREPTPGRRVEIVSLLRRRSSPARDRAVLTALWPWDGKTPKYDIADALGHAKTSEAIRVLETLARDPDRSASGAAMRSLGRKDTRPAPELSSLPAVISGSR